MLAFSDDTNYEPFFIHTGAGKVVPRVVMIDLEPTPIGTKFFPDDYLL